MQPILANVLQPLIDVFAGVLKFFHESGGLSWGLAIVALTVTIRALLLPLTLKQIRSMRGMQQIAPQMKSLKDKHRDDPQRMNSEMMALYRENKINPLASCLPIVAQLPVFISLFYMLRVDLRADICPSLNPPGGSLNTTRPCGESPESGFLFIPDITDRATGLVLVSLVVLYVATQLASSLLMTMTADRNQRMIFLALPFLFVPFIWSFPAGLLLYWITTNTWTIVQQAIVRKRVGPMQPVPTGGLSELFGGRSKGGDDDPGEGHAARKPRGARDGAEAKGVRPGSVALADGPRARTAAPPPPPRRKKKQRSGRRR